MTVTTETYLLPEGYRVTELGPLPKEKQLEKLANTVFGLVCVP